MNYRHSFHAGNFADVMKHIALLLVIEHLKKKDKPFRVIDTHGGAGLYDLSGADAQRSGEWHDGIGKVLAALGGGKKMPEPVASVLSRYADLVCEGTTAPPAAQIKAYPGSPLIAARMLRPGDKLYAAELHPDAAASLRRALKPFPVAKVSEADGWTQIASLLPLPERRGVILIDPPFETAGEFDRLTTALKDGTRRFQTGIYLLWYPIKDRRLITKFHRAIAALGVGNVAAYELMVQSERVIDRLNGCGLIVANAPFGFDRTYGAVLKELAAILGRERGSCANVVPLTGKPANAAAAPPPRKPGAPANPAVRRSSRPLRPLRPKRQR